MRGLFEPGSDPYRTPDGYQDYPYMYVLEARGLTDGQSYYGMAVDIDNDADFVLRRIAGLNYVANSMLLYNASGSRAFSAPMQAPLGYGVLPEKVYPAGNQILLDLITVARAAIVCGGAPIYDSAQLVFQGVNRYKKESYQPRLTPYRYYEVPYTYQMNVSLATWYDPLLIPYRVPLNNYDFELHALRIGVAGTGAALVTNPFQIVLYDPVGYRLMRRPVNQGLVNNAVQWGLGLGSVFPVPTMVWPAAGEIYFELKSLICATDLVMPKTYSFEFIGVQRKPC